MISIKKSVIYFSCFSLFTIIYAGNFTVNNVSQFQAALNTAASNGQNDTINVLTGMYNVNPSLTYSSTENFFLLIRGSGNPVLDGANTRQVMTLSTTSQSADITIDGLTFQHGRADYGGGLNIQTQGADIIVRNCTVNDNTANFVSGGVNLFSNTGYVTVLNCSFSRNTSPNTSGYPYGNAGGLFIQTDGAGTIIQLTGCTFTLNTSQRDAAGAMLYPLGVNSTVIAESNTFTNNTAKESGGGCWIRGPGGNTTVRFSYNTLNGNSCTVGGNGGGTYIQIASGLIDVFDNIHSGNYSIWQGGGLWIEHSGGTLNIYRNRFINNTSGESGGGANLFLDYGIAKIDHNVFNKNRTTGAGGGINFSTNTGRINIFNNTLYLNNASEGGDVNIYFDNAAASSNFYNNILFNSTLPALTYSGQQTVIARYCDIKGGIGQPWFGAGCIDIYPFFRDTAGADFHLQDSLHCSSLRYSRCIDAGNPDVLDSILNCNWGLGLNRSDMGAYGGKGTISIGIKKLATIVPEEYRLFQNYPNPFNPITKIKFNIGSGFLPSTRDGNDKVFLQVYDALGREVQTLVNEQLQPGTYEVYWDGNNFSSGVYYYKITAVSYTDTRKMVLLK